MAVGKKKAAEQMSDGKKAEGKNRVFIFRGAALPLPLSPEQGAPSPRPPLISEQVWLGI